MVKHNCLISWVSWKIKQNRGFVFGLFDRSVFLLSQYLHFNSKNWHKAKNFRRMNNVWVKLSLNEVPNKRYAFSINTIFDWMCFVSRWSNLSYSHYLPLTSRKPFKHYYMKIPCLCYYIYDIFWNDNIYTCFWLLLP